MKASPGTDGSAHGSADLAVDGEKLLKLADDLDTMREVLRKQLLRMDEIVDGMEARWRGPASAAYRAKHRAAAEDAVRIRKTMEFLARAVRLSRGGFSADELDILEQFQRVQVNSDIQAETDELSTPNSAQAAPRSRLTDL